jgi:hypothetical protein
MIVGQRWEHTNQYPNGQRWLTSVLLDAWNEYRERIGRRGIRTSLGRWRRIFVRRILRGLIRMFFGEGRRVSLRIFGGLRLGWSFQTCSKMRRIWMSSFLKSNQGAG